LKLFENYPWEGNVRELENTIEGIMHIYDISTIEVEHIPTKIIKNQIKRTNIKENSLNKILEETERNLILEALKETGNNITHAAELLQIPRQTLQYRILKHKL
jgi:arginine utilization regulatory protein